MPWKERSIVEERMRFVLRLKDGESMASLCREFGISRVTGYKIYERYKECGLEGLTDRARTPYRYANKLPAQLEAMIVSMRREKPTWGARKLRDRLLRKLPNDVRVPARSTIHAILDRHGLVATTTLSHKNRRYPSISRTYSQCFVVHRLQRRVHAGR
jgi:transposase